MKFESDENKLVCAQGSDEDSSTDLEHAFQHAPHGHGDEDAEEDEGGLLAPKGQVKPKPKVVHENIKHPRHRIDLGDSLQDDVDGRLKTRVRFTGLRFWPCALFCDFGESSK